MRKVFCFNKCSFVRLDYFYVIDGKLEVYRVILIVLVMWLVIEEVGVGS